MDRLFSRHHRRLTHKARNLGIKLIGITGSAGMGKSSLVQQLKTLKSGPIFDADLEIKKLYKDPVVLKALQNAFPGAFVNGVIDKQILRQILQGRPDKLALLETILYPSLRQRRLKFIQKMKRFGYEKVFLDIPLLYEKGWDKNCHEVICVTCSDWLQEQRLLKRCGVTPAFIALLRQNQWPSRRKTRYATCVIQTGVGRHFTLRQLQMYLKEEKRRDS